jgi:hypothetical protein
MFLVSSEGEVIWRYDMAEFGLSGEARPEFSWEGATIYAHGIRNGSEGIWAIPSGGGEPRLAVAYDDAEIAGFQWFSLGPDRIYVTVGQYESDIWVMDVEVER